MKSNIRRFTPIIIITLFILLFYLNPILIKNSVIESIDLFYSNIFTMLFPFYIFIELLLNYNFHYYISYIMGKFFSNLLNISSVSSFIIIISMICGSPTNAIFIKEYLDKKIIDIDEAEFLLNITSMPSSVFIIILIGSSYLNSTKLGILIYLSIVLTNFLISLFIKSKKTKHNIKIITYKSKSIFEIIPKAIIKSFNTLLIILGNITIFIIIVNLLENYFLFNKISISIVSSFLELTIGIKKISNINILLISFFSYFLGLSIHFQILSILDKYNINYKNFIILRIIGSVISIIIFSIMISLLF